MATTNATRYVSESESVRMKIFCKKNVANKMRTSDFLCDGFKRGDGERRNPYAYLIVIIFLFIQDHSPSQLNHLEWNINFFIHTNATANVYVNDQLLTFIRSLNAIHIFFFGWRRIIVYNNIGFTFSSAYFFPVLFCFRNANFILYDSRVCDVYERACVRALAVGTNIISFSNLSALLTSF